MILPLTMSRLKMARWMRRGFAVLVVAMMMPPAAAFTVDTPKQIVERHIQAWIAAHDRSDVEALTALYAPDALLLPPFTQDPLIGTEAIRAYFNTLLLLPGNKLALESTNVVQADNLLYAAGRWQEEVGSRPVHGLFLFILGKQGDDWKALADTWNNDQ